MRTQFLLAMLAAFLLGLYPPSVHAGDGGWWPAFSSAETEPETLEYITNAKSPLGGDCCAWADGFQLGKSYQFFRGDLEEETPESTRRVVLYSWTAEPDGYYAVVWDYIVTGKLVTLRADYRAFAPGNPTGTPIVWIRRKDKTNEIEIRCYGGEPQS